MNSAVTDVFDRERGRRALISTVRKMNRIADAVFYDTSVLLDTETEQLTALKSPEGAVVVVSPSEMKECEVMYPSEFVEKVEAGEHGNVDTIVLAGVGSSAVGTAALARNVADYLGKPVLGIVSGFGMADVMSEALGGWFAFGASNRLRDLFAHSLDWATFRDHVRDTRTHGNLEKKLKKLKIDRSRIVFASPDTFVLLYLIAELGARIRLLVGHSKGSYSIEGAMREWIRGCKNRKEVYSDKIKIVTVGAVARFPDECQNVSQVLGRIDMLGIVNSIPWVDREIVPGTWHSLNSKIPGHLSVETALELSRVPRGQE